MLNIQVVEEKEKNEITYPYLAISKKGKNKRIIIFYDADDGFDTLTGKSVYPENKYVPFSGKITLSNKR